ncbi:DUF3959 family protein [Bacillus clarus]|uniref:DUF3959 family protein n=1 Tax=Bacillus clarus TaxID=2338372 RepID=A0A090YZR2_9BACI|nr:DUF3959 family protein [Bacillus clarus]KFN03563.1 hypothetical protein DJ93_5111 [Bacillus clarus]RFT64379.1 DUF3959 family protein [Bacillus clarus]
MKKLDVLLMVLSGLFPVAGIMKQTPLELSLFIGGLLFFTSFGSYFAKKMYSRICSWIAYASFTTLLLVIWNQYVTTSSVIANVKIAACVALIPCVFRFRTYGLTVGLLSLWGALLWDIKQIQSLAVLERIMNIMTTQRFYLLLLIGGMILGGLLAMALHRKDSNEKQENTNLFKQKKKRIKPTFKIRIPRLPKFKVKRVKFGRKPSKQKAPETYERNYVEQEQVHHKLQPEQHHHEVEIVQGQTRMERRRNRNA